MADLRVFIGWDSREEIAYEVAKLSLLKNASIDVEVIPIANRPRIARAVCEAIDCASKARVAKLIVQIDAQLIRRTGWTVGPQHPAVVVGEEVAGPRPQRRVRSG